MGEEKSKEGDGDFPWMSCVAGCRPPEDKEVTLLKCLHVICSPTCSDNWKKKLTLKEGCLPYCPLCRMLVKEEDLKEKVILNKVFPPKLSKDNVKLICNMCICDKPATNYCPTCPNYLCDDCAHFHSVCKMWSNHTLDKNLEQRRDIEFQTMLEKHNQCKVEGHADSPITKYCTTCQEKLCAQCTTDHDASHKILDTKKGKEFFIANLEATKELYVKVGERIEKTRCKREEFSPKKYFAICSKINKDFANMNQTLWDCHKLIMAEVRKAFKRRVTNLAALETRLEVLKKKIAQICKACGSVQENLDEVATYYFSLLASESRENVNVFGETLKNGYLNMIDDSNEFSLDPKFMKKVQSMLEEGPVKVQYEMDFNNLDETETVPLDGDKKVQNAGGGASTSEKAIIVTSVSSLKPSASQPPKRRIAVKSTGFGGGRPLGMPHLERRPSLSPIKITYKPLPPPPPATPVIHPFINGGKPMRTYPAPSRKSATVTAAATSTSGVTITPIPSTSATTPNKSQSNESAGTPQTTAFQMYITSTKRERKQNLNNGTSQSGTSVTVTISDGKARNGGDTSGNDLVCKEETSDKMEVDSPSKTNGMGFNEAKENGGKENSVITVPSPGISPNGTSLSDSSDNVVTVRVGLRNRKKKVYTDCVDPTKDIKFSKKEDMLQDSSESTVLPSLGSRSRSKSQSQRSDIESPPTKIARKNEDTEDTASSVSLSQGLDETGSENGFESGTDSVQSVPSTRRQSLRKRGDSSASRPSTPFAPAELANDKKKGKGVKIEAEMHDSSKWKEAPLASIMPVPDWVDFPTQGASDQMKNSESDFNEDYCCICLDGGEETLVCCDFCPKVFHLKCHIPVVEEVPGEDEKWICNYHKSKGEFELELSTLEEEPLSENLPLTKSNQVQFLRACKFMMEVYKIPEIPTMKWNFPQAYQSKYNQVPYHLSYLRDKLCLYDEKNYEPYSNKEDFIRSFHQMFLQALHTYQTMNFVPKDRKAAFACFRKFRKLCDQYYPSFSHLFIQLDLEAIFPD